MGEATLKWRKKGFRKERGGQVLSLREVNKEKNTENCLLSFQFRKESRSLITLDVTIIDYSSES